MNSNFDKRFYQKTVNKHYLKKHQELRHGQSSIKKSMTKERPYSKNSNLCEIGKN